MQRNGGKRAHIKPAYMRLVLDNILMWVQQIIFSRRD